MTRRARSVVYWVVVIGGLAAIIGSARTASGQGDPAVGSWKLNASRSTYSPGPVPKSQTVTISAVPNGIKVNAKGVDGDGRPTSTEYTARYDGNDVPVLFNLVFDATSLRRIDAHTSELQRKKAGKVVQTARRAISADGRTMTITTTGLDEKGRTVNNVAVYEKQ